LGEESGAFLKKSAQKTFIYGSIWHGTSTIPQAIRSFLLLFSKKKRFLFALAYLIAGIAGNSRVMDLAPAVIVHGLEQARAALAPGRPVVLLSAPGAALFGGCLWWRALTRAAGAEGLSLLDCADAPGRALEALRLGLPGVVLGCEAAAFRVVMGVAATTGAVVLPAPPPALDLGKRGAERHLQVWLGG
jgi:hypothetical protein